MIKWFKTLFRIVDEAKRNKPNLCILTHKDGYQTSFVTHDVPYDFNLPDVVAKEYKMGDQPEIAKMVRFQRTYTTEIGNKLVAMYKEI